MYLFALAGTFLGTVGGAAAIFGFSKTLMASKREEQKLLEKGLIEGTHVLDAGSALARRALGYGTLYAVLGTGALCFGVWKLSGASNVNSNFIYNLQICTYVCLIFNFLDERVSPQNGQHIAQFKQRWSAKQPH